MTTSAAAEVAQSHPDLATGEADAFAKEADAVAKIDVEGSNPFRTCKWLRDIACFS
jgi:hypothetical protein